jgi:hypothetical protein
MFNKSHPVFNELPADGALNWPYQALIHTGVERMGIVMEGEELLVGAYHTYPMALGTSMGIIPVGKGKVLFSTLDIYGNIVNPSSAGLVAQKLVCNMIDFKSPSLDGFSDGIHHWNLEHRERTYQRFTPDQVHEIASNLMAYQNKDGGWPKNIDWLGVLNTDSVYQKLKESYKRSTLDNRNTFPQIEYLTKLGLHNIAMSTQILQLCGKDKKFCKWLAKNRQDIVLSDYYVSSIMKAYKTGKPIREIRSTKKTY